jgi:mono/diheme cytochrome c family protein
MRRRAIPVAALAFLVAGAPVSAQEAAPGRDVYDRWCAGCHGVEGEGDGPAAGTMLPRPRDFTTAQYQVRSTPSGALPTDADILHVIDEGMPGTAMPGWKDHLSEEQRQALVDVLKGFSSFFESESPAEPIDVGSPSAGGEDAVAAGRETYEKIECWKCHGRGGRGDGTSAPTLEDEDGLPIRAADLTEGWHFNGGSSVEAIYTRFRTGMNGTPMPSFSDLIEAEVVTDEQLWQVAHFVKSLSPETPRVSEVVRAALLEEGELPATVDDERWSEVERFYVPLVGQIIEEPRWFAPSVDGVWVQALHDGEGLAVLLTWNDPSRSPDPAWDEWTAKIEAAMSGAAAPSAGAADVPAAVDSAPAGGPGQAASTPTPSAAASGQTAPAQAAVQGADPAEPPPGGLAALGHPYDSLVIQFPTAIPEGMQRPYFLMGGADDPVYLWVWGSGREGVGEAVGHGFGDIRPLGGETILTAAAEYADGQWRLLVRRPLSGPEAENRLQIGPGRAIPMAIFAWDGSNGESGKRGSISTWYFLYLDRPTGKGVYVWPALATLLTAGLGLVLVARAQRRSREGTDVT